MTAEAPRRASRCDHCGLEDTLGKHHIAVGTVADEATGQPVLLTESFHFTCCLARGCPDGSCTAALEAERARLAS